MFHGDPSFVLQIAEKEQELLASQETVQVRAHWEGAGNWDLQRWGQRGAGSWVRPLRCGAQVLQMKVRRLEHLLQLKNVRIEDLSRRLQQAERKQR